MKDQISKLYIVNGKSIRYVIGQYIDRKDIGGLSEFFRAFLEDLSEIIDNKNI